MRFIFKPPLNPCAIPSCRVERRLHGVVDRGAAQGIAIIIAKRPLGLPGREWPERQQLGEDCGQSWHTPGRATSTADPDPRRAHAR